MSRFDASLIGGWVARGFEPVREAFQRNFVQHGEVGAACAVYHAGKPVVDLWGGYRDRRSHEPWHKDTLVPVFSTAQGLTSLALALAHSRGWLDYDSLVAAYWPDFAQKGKGDVTVRQLLAHEAGLVVLDEPATPGLLRDHDALAAVLARQTSAWTPGTQHGYHFHTLGLYEGELMRRVDPERRTLGRFFQEELAEPAGLEFYFGLPPDVPERRLATMVMFGPGQILTGLARVPPRLSLALLDRNSLTYRAFHNPDATQITPDIELPSGNGIGLVRGVAKAYGALAAGGAELGLTRATFEELNQPSLAAARSAQDRLLYMKTVFSLGFLRPCPAYRFGTTSRALGMTGLGGSVGFADPDTQVGFAYAPNRMRFSFFDDQRAESLQRAVYRCVG